MSKLVSAEDAGGDLEADLVIVARVARTRGLRGEVVADLLTDVPERFDDVTRLIALWSDGRREAIALEQHWFQRDRIVFKFAGRDTVEQAQSLVGCELAVPEDESVQLPDDEFFHWELEGCQVETLSGQKLGHVSEVIETGAVPVLMIKDDNGRETLIPLADEICVEINVDQKLIRIDPPEGLLEM
ncbi:MAG: ribosome maturation factor RimM [Pyrinomonadaceae bacterium]